MSSPLAVSRQTLARFLLAFQHLASRYPRGEAGLLQAVRDLECVQIDPVALVARNEDLALMARCEAYQPADLERLRHQGHVCEDITHAACLIVAEDLPLLKGNRARRLQRLMPELDAYRDDVRMVLARLEHAGPLKARDFVSNRRVQGYWDNQGMHTKATSHVLNLLQDAGLIRVVGRAGSQRIFDLAHRGLDAHVVQRFQDISEQEADQGLLEKYLRAVRVVPAADPLWGWQRHSAKERVSLLSQMVRERRLQLVTLPGSARPYYIRTEDVPLLESLQAHGAQGMNGDARVIRFLPPLDNLLWKRGRLADLFAFEYRWEIYTPAEKRTFGPYTMPILAGDQFIGRMDASFQRQTRSLAVQRIAWEPGMMPDSQLMVRVQECLSAWAADLGAVKWTGGEALK